MAYRHFVSGGKRHLSYCEWEIFREFTPYNLKEMSTIFSNLKWLCGCYFSSVFCFKDICYFLPNLVCIDVAIGDQLYDVGTIHAP